MTYNYHLTSVTTNTTRYVWGQDISGTLQGAGGVGGLLAVHTEKFPSGGGVPQAGWSFPCYDANGNVTEYVDTNGVVVAHYQYDAFGNTVAQSGSLADEFRFRFSTKYFDSETGLYYYGYIRYYSSLYGRFISQDPIEEQGGLNLYAFCNNDPINKWDYLGMVAHWHHLLPQAPKFARYFANIDIHSAEFGWILEGAEHTGKGGLHPKWNSIWQEFFDKNPRAGKTEIIEQLDKMKNMPEFKQILDSGRPAKVSHQTWLKDMRKVRMAAIKESAKKGSRKIAKRVPVLGVVFIISDVERKGFVYGTSNALLDACPWIGWGKAAIECVTGDWFPDKDEYINK